MLLMLIGCCFFEIITFVSSGGFLHFSSESAMPEAQGIFVVHCGDSSTEFSDVDQALNLSLGASSTSCRLVQTIVRM